MTDTPLSWNLKDKTALICGASQGIGKAAAQLLAERGARLILLARNEEKLKSLIASLPGQGHKAMAVDFSQIEELRKNLLPTLKNEKVHILMNNSGGPKGGLLHEADIMQFEEPFRSHLQASHLLVQSVLPSMKESGYGRIVNVISTSVKTPLPNLGVSNTIRGAMANWSKTLAMELASWGITVNNVLPGYTQTDRFENLLQETAQKIQKEKTDIEEQWKKSIPMGRIASPGEIAEAIAFLSSPAASYITGINLPVDGGRTPSL